MPLITAKFLGRFGNQCMQYAFSRAYAEQHGCGFQCDPWIGQRIFEISDVPISQDLPRRSELDMKEDEVNIQFYGYAQHQRCMIYTKQWAQNVFRIKPHLLEILQRWKPYPDVILAHRRVGDYYGYGYVVVSEKSYLDACTKFDLPVELLQFITEENSNHCPELDRDMEFLLDFYRLTQASILLRGNSTFSWFAALLSNASVYSPVIEGKTGGQEHDCEFVRGNYPRFANLDFVTDLHEAVHRES